MTTAIYTSKKLEKLIQKIINKEEIVSTGLLGTWKATIFYVDRKKCWLISNTLTQYNVILTDIKTRDLPKIDTIFKSSLFNQFLYDGLNIEYSNIENLIGNLVFYSTDNDRRTTGFQTDKMHTIDVWKDQFGSLELMDVPNLTHRLNDTPIQLNVLKKTEYTYALVEMARLLNKNGYLV